MSLHELYQGCRTYRRFLQTPIEKDVLLSLVDDARISSSAANAQPLKYTIVHSQDAVATFQDYVKWAAYLPKELGTPVKGEQPVAFIVITKDQNALPMADIDVGIAAHALVLSAYDKGIGSCMMGAINTKAIRDFCHIEQKDAIRLVIALGYPAHTSTLVEAKDESLHYYLDDKRNYYVPKRALKDIVTLM